MEQRESDSSNDGDSDGNSGDDDGHGHGHGDGSTLTFEQFVAARGDRLHRSAWLLTGDPHTAEDLVQTVLAKVWPKWRRIARDNPEAYIRRALINTHIAWWQRRWRGETPTRELPETAMPGDVFADVDLGQSLMTALRQLPPRQRAVVVLRFFEDLSVDETADILNCHPGTVKSQSAKALQSLRQVLATSPSLWVGEQL